MSLQATGAYQTRIRFMEAAVDAHVYTWRKGYYYCGSGWRR